MTRFARVKSSNDHKRHEEATSWKEIRKQLEANQIQNKLETEVKEEIKPNWKYKIACDDAHEQNKNSSWAVFNEPLHENKKKKKKKVIAAERSLSCNEDVNLKTEKKKIKKHSSIKDTNEQSYNSGTLIKNNELLTSVKEKKNLIIKKEKKKICDGNINLKNKRTVEEDEKSSKQTIKIKSGNDKSQSKQTFYSKELDSNVSGENQMVPQYDNSSNSFSNNKKHKNGNYARRKPNPGNYTAYINGKNIDIVCFEGFFIKKEDAENLRRLRKQFIKKGIPRNELQAIMKLERRKAEKALAREKKKVCFQCRKSGHNLSECPELQKNGTTVSGICFKCGSTEHTYFDCKVSHGEDFRFAQCFICKEEGHIAKQCPDNPRGLYPKGGACRICGDVTHMKRDCPDSKQQTEKTLVTAQTFNNGRSLDVLDEELNKIDTIKKPVKKIKYFK